jgi:hypothetical protein
MRTAIRANSDKGEQRERQTATTANSDNGGPRNHYRLPTTVYRLHETQTRVDQASVVRPSEREPVSIRYRRVRSPSRHEWGPIGAAQRSAPLNCPALLFGNLSAPWRNEAGLQRSEVQIPRITDVVRGGPMLPGRSTPDGPRKARSDKALQSYPAILECQLVLRSR